MVFQLNPVLYISSKVSIRISNLSLFLIKFFLEIFKVYVPIWTVEL
jgi:hypothetical protein